MKRLKLFPLLLALLALCACAPQQTPPQSSAEGVPVQEDALLPASSSEKPPAQEGDAASPAVDTHQESSTIPAAIPEDETFVRVQDYLPQIYVDLKYATEDNFTGTVIYAFSDAYLRYGTVKKLQAVMNDLSADGYSLKIWDAFRPTAAQWKLWEICPDPVYVSDPNKGFSSHSRGNTVDVTLVYTDGSTVDMPTDFDDFSPLADRDYSDVDEPAAGNARYLEQVMTAHGFTPYSGEWWHFSDADTYEVEENFFPGT